MVITPAIFADSYEHVISKLFIFEGLTEWVQIDICDGSFGLEKTWLPYRETHLVGGFSYEFDLMVNDWRKYLPRVIALGAKRVVMHIDHMSDDDINEMLEIIRPHFIYLGLSVSNTVDIHAFIEKVKWVEKKYTKLFIQVMGIKRIGAQGQPFDGSILRRISYLREEVRTIDVQVDGSMNPETILKVTKMGARCAIVGSYLFSKGITHNDVKKTLQTLREDYR